MSSSKLLTKLTLLTFILFSFSIVAQDTEEVTVVGTQIKGASISSALPVSVYSIDDIEALGIDSGDELLDALTEQGQNQFAEASESGGINSSRGDIGAYNLRNIGAGNTLVLLNGRRLVSSPGYQNELIGGGYTPVATVNSNLIPTSGLDRLEVLRDGASAIYGADAVTGVVNNVTNTDFEGFTIKSRSKNFSGLGMDDNSLNIQYGTKPSNNSSFTVSYDYLSKGKARARDHRVMSQGDLRQFLPGGNSDPHAAFFDNTSSQAYLGQFDMLEGSSGVDSNTRSYVDSRGEFQVLPIADARCAASEGSVTAIYNTGYGTCIVSDSSTNSLTKWNKNTYAWVRGETDRHNLLINFNNDLESGMTLYNEIAYYESNYYSERDLSATYPYKLRVGAASFYNPLRDSTGLPGSSASRPLALGNDFDKDAELHIDNFRYGHLPKTVSVEKSTYRFLQGVSGSYNDWDYDGALVISQARSLDTSGNRIDFDLMQKALFDTTSAGYNILCDWVNTDCSTNIEQTLVNVQKKQTSDLRMIDLKFTNNELFSTEAGPASFLIGLEYREEAYEDDRDPKLDGTVTYQNLATAGEGLNSGNGYCVLGNTTTGVLPTGADGRVDPSALDASCRPATFIYPYVGAVAGGSPTADSTGERDTTSLFTELSVPLMDNLDMQVAARYEDTSDFGSEMVGKVAFGFQANDMVLLRASASNTFRAPNLITMNQGALTRFNSDNRDYSKSYTENSSEMNEWIYRRALKNPNLNAETSTNVSFGVVIEPMQDLTFIIDAYSIEKDDTVGNFGTSNEIAIEFLNRYNAKTGTADASESAALTRCNANLNYGNVYRVAADGDNYDDMSANAKSLGMCPLGSVQYVQSQYQNLAERTVEGVDVAAYYDWDNDYGSWSFRYRGAFTTKLEQLAAPGTSAATLQKAIADGTFTAALTALGASSLPAVVAEGYGSLEGTDSYFEDKHSIRLSWRKNAYSVALTGKFISDYVQSAVVDSNSNPFIVDSMRTFNLAASYRFDWEDARMKVTLGSNNILDEEAPLADDTYGYDPDVHNNYGRSIYLDVRASF